MYHPCSVHVLEQETSEKLVNNGAHFSSDGVTNGAKMQISASLQWKHMDACLFVVPIERSS